MSKCNQTIVRIVATVFIDPTNIVTNLQLVLLSPSRPWLTHLVYRSIPVDPLHNPDTHGLSSSPMPSLLNTTFIFLVLWHSVPM